MEGINFTQWNIQMERTQVWADRVALKGISGKDSNTPEKVHSFG